MSNNRRRDTSIEIAVRSALHRRGLRFRVDFPIRVPGRRPIRPDVVFQRAQLAVFIDGCFWHRCPAHGSLPKSNLEYWKPKLDANVQRDQAANALLADQGWTVLRAWEHDPIAEIVDRVETTLHEVI